MKASQSIVICFLIQLFSTASLMAQPKNTLLQEQHRPQVHFSPAAHWINDPNGMVYYKGIYHLFFQYYPGSTVWGPMHWGHSTCKDLIHWQEQPIALYPDSLGYIFSGSAVVDFNNTSGFGKNGKVPMIAIFTHHDTTGEKAGRIDFQKQSIAYSLNEGKTWIKYAGNPVLTNPGIADFRDPKVMWYAPQKKWIMTLATKSYITFYSSPDLKNWSKESEFGKTVGAHGGVWECPDLISMDDNGKQRWVLIVNINPGAPNGGSGTQYFIGDFDGKNFISNQTEPRWMDYGPDNYAGITWSNTGERKVLIGWMSNWSYATQVPTKEWRSAMTLPRDLTLKHAGDQIYLSSQIIPELAAIGSKPFVIKSGSVQQQMDAIKKMGKLGLPCRINLSADEVKDFSLVLSNTLEEKLVIGFDKAANQFFIDRSQSGKTNFNKDFAGRHVAPRFTDTSSMNVSLVIDVSSVELFADDGLTVMTSIFFPNKPYDQMKLQSKEGVGFSKIEYIKLSKAGK